MFNQRLIILLIAFISILLFQKDNKLNIEKHYHGINDSIPTDTITFQGFEKIFKESYDGAAFIPLCYILKFVQFNDTSVILKDSCFYAVNFSHIDNYKILLMSYVYLKYSKDIFITYDLHDKQTDCKVFLRRYKSRYYKKTNSINGFYYNMETYEPKGIVSYIYDTLNQEEVIHESFLDPIDSLFWKINKKGKFEKIEK
jgi:hypothetical protein